MNSSHPQTNVSSHANGNSLYAQPPSAESVLRELSHLLEEYGPAWYTEELQVRISLALGDVPSPR
jgi:hypothetical protein